MADYADDVRERVWGAEGKDPLTCIYDFNDIEYWDGPVVSINARSRTTDRA